MSHFNARKGDDIRPAVAQKLKFNLILKTLYTSLLEFSSRRKSKTLFGGTGSQNEVAALSTIPGGLPGSSMLFRVMTRTSSAPLPDSVVHVCAVDAPTPVQKLITILSASFNILFLPSGEDITGKLMIHD